MKHLENKVVVITGAASGIGQALARSMAARGAVLALVDINETALDSICAELVLAGGTVSSHVIDVSHRQSMEQLPCDIANRHGSIEVLINNAGVSVGALFDDHSIDDAEWLLDINLKGVIYGCKFFLPYLKASSEAHIVNVSSMFGFFSMPGQAIYSASKAGVRGFTEALWTELASTTVRVTTVHPGTISSNVIRSSRMLDADMQVKAAQLQEKYGMRAAKAAENIVAAVEKGLQKNVKILWPNMEAKILQWLRRFSPRLLWKLIHAAN